MKLFGKKINITGNSTIIIRNVYWSLLSKIANLVSGLLVGILVARYLGPEQFGLMNYVVSYVSIFLIFATFGLDNIEIREESKAPKLRDKILGTTFWLRMILSVMTILLIIITALISETDNYTISLIVLYALSVIFSAFDVIRNHFTSLVKNEYVAQVSIARTIVACIIKLALVYYNASLVWFIGTLTFETFFQAQGFYVAYKKIIGNISTWTFDKSIAKIMLQQSFPLMLSGAAAYIFLRIDQIMIGKMINNISVGYFAVASKIVEILLFLPTIVIQTISPILIRIKTNKPKEIYKQSCQQVLNISVWLSFILSIFTVIFAYPAIRIFGIEYLPAVFPLQLLAFKTIGTTLNVISGQILIIDNKQKYFILRSVSGCLACIILNYLVIPHYGIAGVCIIASVTQLIAGWIIHFFIPQYRYVFKMQSRSLLYGWRDIRNIFRGKIYFLNVNF